MTERSNKILSIRALSFLAFFAVVSVVPLAKTGHPDAASSVGMLSFLLITGLLLAWNDAASFKFGSFIRLGLLTLFVALAGLFLTVLSGAVFGAPLRIVTAYRRILERLFFHSNKVQLLFGLTDSTPSVSWRVIVAVLSCVVLVAFVVWIARMRLTVRWLASFCAIALFGVIVGLLAPSSEFRISSSAEAAQMAFNIATAPAGNFVVAWQSRLKDVDDFELYARLYGPDGAARTDELHLNTYTPENQFVPRTGVDERGNFAIVWESKGQDGSGYGVYCRRYDSDGVPQGEEFQVNTTTAGGQNDPAIAMLGNGDFVVVWGSDDGSSSGIFGQRFDAAGNRLGEEFQVNTFTAGVQKKPLVASDPLGNFTVVWPSEGQDGSGIGVFAQRFDRQGSRLGDEFQVNTYTADDQYDIAVNVNATGGAVVVWSSLGQDGSGLGVYARRYSASGDALGEEFRVNTFVDGDQNDPSVSSDVDGNFVVVWESEAQDGNAAGVFGRRYGSTGEPLGDEFQVNVYSTSRQVGPSVTYNSPGHFVVVWTSFGQDGYAEGVFGRMFSD
jgi:hypothetical protein